MADLPVTPHDEVEKHLTAAGALTTLLTGLAAPFANSYKYLGYILFAVSSILLLVIAAIRLNKSLSKKKHIVPLVSGLVVLCIIALGLAGWSIRHPSPLPQPAAQTSKHPAEPVVHDSTVNSTIGPNSPISNGANTTVIVNSQATEDQPKAHPKRH